MVRKQEGGKEKITEEFMLIWWKIRRITNIESFEAWPHRYEREIKT